MHIQNLHIQNFKSIRDLHLTGFKRINLLIGRPNVGKSNILEAVSMFSIPYLKYSSKKLTDLVRMESLPSLFYEGNVEYPIQITIDKHLCNIFYERKKGLNILFDHWILGINEKFIFKDNIDLLKPNLKSLEETNIKSYKFSEIKFKKINVPFLVSPFGNNLMGVLETLPELTQEISQLFENYGLRLMFDETNHSLRIVKERSKTLFSLSYHSIADTLRRVIFFKTAIRSNENSVLLFEEPEAHAFPPYIRDITYEITESESNQFFIATHSPYILNDFLENAREDLAIFMVDYQDGQTVAKALSEQDISEVYRYGLDVFFNYESFL